MRRLRKDFHTLIMNVSFISSTDVGSHNRWRGERSIRYECVETCLSKRVLKILRKNLKRII